MKNKNLMDILLHSYVTCGWFNMLHGACVILEMNTYCNILRQQRAKNRLISLCYSLIIHQISFSVPSLLLVSMEQANRRFRQKIVKIYRSCSTMAQRILRFVVNRDWLLCEGSQRLRSFLFLIKNKICDR